MPLSDFIATLALVISVFTFGWTIYRDCVDKPNLKLKLFVADVAHPMIPEKRPQVLALNITNNGKKPIVVKAHGFRIADGTTYIFPDMMSHFNGKKLEPYDFLDITFPNESLCVLVEKSEQLDSFVVCDTTGKEWKLPKKNMSELKASLGAKKNKA